MYDIFFVSYDEPNADNNWNDLISRIPIARRIHGIEGISNAHLTCAKQSFTKMFWTVDGDTIVTTDWDFSFQPPAWDENYLHVWYSRNPLNDLEYGYGAVKLWPKSKILNYSGTWLDFTTSIGNIKIMPETIATTNFNTGPYETWKSAFRESVKLQKNISMNPDDIDSKSRFNAWKTAKSSVPYSEWCNKGVIDAIEFYNNSTDLSFINDFKKLNKLFSVKYNI